MGSSYHQFCPVAKAMELLDQRWTLLVIREMLCGSTRFNDLRRGVPHMSPTLLSKRLHQLVRAGLVERREGSEVHYVLTPAGLELQQVVQALGTWGVRWVGELGDADLDPRLLMWDMHRNIDLGAVPAGMTVLQFRFSDVPAGSRDWWLVLRREGVDVCDVDPGFPVTLTLDTSLRQMVQVWRGDSTWSAALRTHALELRGPQALCRAAPGWFILPALGSVPRASPQVGLLQAASLS